MDRIKRFSNEILKQHKEKFGTNFIENKKTLDQISIIRSKGLKNELAGFITKIIKRELREDDDTNETVESNNTVESTDSNPEVKIETSTTLDGSVSDSIKQNDS